MKLTKCLSLQLLLLLALAFAEGGVLSSVQSMVSTAEATMPIHIFSNGVSGSDGHSVAVATHLGQGGNEGSKVVQIVKAYIPPELSSYLKKEVRDLVVKEGSRFAMKHPKETADIVAIAGKMKSLYKLVISKVKK